MLNSAKMTSGEGEEKRSQGKRRGQGSKEGEKKSHSAGGNVSNAKIKVKQSEVEKMVAKRQKERLRMEAKAKRELSKREEKYKKQKAKAAEKQKKQVVKLVEKRKKARKKRKKKASGLEADEEEEEEEDEEEEEAAAAAARSVTFEAQASEPSRWRLPWKKKSVRRVQTVAASSRMAVPGRFLRIPPDLRLSRKDLRLARAFLQFPPPTGYPFKAGWPWTTAGQGHNVLVADSDCEQALRRQRRRKRLARKAAQQPKNAALAMELRRLDRPGGSFLERYTSQMAPQVAAMPTLLSDQFGGAPAMQLSRGERRRFLDMPLSMCPREELKGWCEARRPFYFSPRGCSLKQSEWKAEEDFCSDSDVSDEEVEAFLKQEARDCVQRIRRKAAIGKDCATMMHRLLLRFEQLPPPLEMPVSSRTISLTPAGRENN